MKKSRIVLIALVCLGIFFLVYFPHFNYKWPLHVDEWYHISETLKIKSGDYQIGYGTFRLGFDLFLLPFSYVFDLVKIYQFFPAIWAVLTGLVLFWIVYVKSRNYWIALLATIFFASLKSNVNLQGLWFFIPSVFAIPFIYLFVYFYSEGIEKRNRRFIFYSLAIAILLVFIHSASFLFMVPFLFVYSLFNLSYIKKEWKFFSSFLIIPLFGIFFYSFVEKVSFVSSIGEILGRVIFTYGHNPLELDNSFLELYSFIGFIFALLGVYYIWKNKDSIKYLAYLLWPLFTLMSIFIFKIFGVSIFAPYQRTMYYFAISLPILSAFGVYYLFKIKDKYISSRKGIINKEYWKKFGAIIIIVLTLILTFYAYNSLPGNVKVYHLIEQKDYDSLLFLKNYSSGRVMAPLDVSMASYAIAGKNAVEALYFYGEKNKTREFFSSNSSNNCTQQNRILIQQNASYVLAEKAINCNWTLIYNRTNSIYNVRNISNPVKKVANVFNKTINASKVI